MRILKWTSILAAFLLVAVSCYWTPPEGTGGSLSIRIQTRELQDYYAYSIRAELYLPDDVRIEYNGEFPVEVITDGEPIPINGKSYFEVATDYDNSGEFTIPNIPLGRYRLLLVRWDYSYDPPEPTNYKGLSDPFEITAGGNALVNITLDFVGPM